MNIQKLETQKKEHSSLDGARISIFSMFSDFSNVQFNLMYSGFNLTLHKDLRDPLWVQFLSFSCSFREKFGQIINPCIHVLRNK